MFPGPMFPDAAYPGDFFPTDIENGGPDPETPGIVYTVPDRSIVYPASNRRIRVDAPAGHIIWDA